MRLRITRQLYDCIDGIQMPEFRTGFVYEVGTMIGCYLLAEGAAEPVTEDTPYVTLPPEKLLFSPVPSFRSLRSPAYRPPVRPPAPIDAAADRAPRRRKHPKRK
jgi:hypothetical protein